MDNFVGDAITSIIRSHAEGIDAGIEMTAKRLFPALRTLEREYVKAESDARSSLPTALGLAIIDVLKFLPRP